MTPGIVRSSDVAGKTMRSIFDYFKMYKDTFENLRAHMNGVRGEPLHYDILDENLPDEFPMEDQYCMAVSDSDVHKKDNQ